MKLHLLAACAALVTLSAGSAFAGDAITAKLTTPVAAKVKFIAGGAMFNCEADTCVAAAPTSSTYATATCKIIADKVYPALDRQIALMTQLRATTQAGDGAWRLRHRSRRPAAGDHHDHDAGRGPSGWA